MKERQPVAVVVVTWNSAATIETCLSSALAERPAEVVVVDNNSADDTLARVAAFDAVKMLPQTSNTGFAAGCNRGISATDSPYVLLLNDDAEMKPGYLGVLVDALQRDRSAASATGKLLLSDRRIDSVGIELRRWALLPLDRGHGEVDRGQFDTPEEIFGPSAAAAVYRRFALEEVGGFDEALFAYYEDVDLAWRLSNRGWRHLYRPDAIAIHDRRGPDVKPTPIAARAFANRYIVFAKNESMNRFLCYFPLAGVWESARLTRRALLQPSLLFGLPRAVQRMIQILRNRAISHRFHGH